jgi:hypothetical protein
VFITFVLEDGGLLGERQLRKESMPSNRFKVVAGSVSVAVALGAGTAVAGAGSESESDGDISLDDVVEVSEVETAPLQVDAAVAHTLADLDDDSFGSPFDDDEVLVGQESPDDDQEIADQSPGSPDESPQIGDESPESPDDSAQSPDDSPESPDDSPESPDDSPESPDDTP